ncbi:hypothetical protein [Haliangium sp.]|uniref:hypothetical protein n=1 Tax=Haliangium sp. TaxID=2663208 RepID=UPI003D0C435E
MLDPWIIEEILRREEETRRDQERRPELPLESPRHPDSIPPFQPEGQDGDSGRGVVIIDI